MPATMKTMLTLHGYIQPKPQMKNRKEEILIFYAGNKLIKEIKNQTKLYRISLKK